MLIMMIMMELIMTVPRGQALGQSDCCRVHTRLRSMLGAWMILKPHKPQALKTLNPKTNWPFHYLGQGSM